MIATATTAFLVSVFVSLVLFSLIRKERHRGRRFFASSLRNKLDKKIESSVKWINKSWEHFGKYVIQLNLYYGIHSLLKGILALIISFYTYFEKKFESNRSRTKQLRAEKRKLSESNHLHQIITHKKETTLTENEQRKLRDKELEGRD